jgi:hypothetical protein
MSQAASQAQSSGTSTAGGISGTSGWMLFAIVGVIVVGVVVFFLKRNGR